MDRETGGVTVWTQNAVGNSEDERSSYHSVHDRLEFAHKEYGQAEYNARLMANAAEGLFGDVGAGRGAVNWFGDGKVAFANAWFPGPLTHPYPAVSNCRTETALAGNPQLPVVGLPDCAGPSSAFDQVGVDPPVPTSVDPGISPDQLKALGIPVPDNYGALAYTGLEEDLSVHLQAFRIGDILFTVCSCEQWADQAQNIKSRTDRVAGDEWAGFDFASYRGLDDTGTDCFERRRSTAPPGPARIPRPRGRRRATRSATARGRAPTRRPSACSRATHSRTPAATPQATPRCATRGS